MNSIECIILFSKNLEQESPHEIPETKPKASWPAEGRVEINDVVLKYRLELPDILRVLSGSRLVFRWTGAGRPLIMRLVQTRGAISLS